MLTLQKLSDAFLSVSIVDPALATKGTRDAVGEYLRDVLIVGALDGVTDFGDLEQSTDPEVIVAVEAEAEIGARIRRVRGLRAEIAAGLPSLGPLLGGIDATVRADAIGALVAAANRMSFDVAVARTENLGGAINISHQDAQKPDAAVIFATIHEFGHTVDYVLREDPRFVPVQQFILPGFQPLLVGRAGRHGLETFADAFAAVYLKAAGQSDAAITTAASELLQGDLETDDHPSGQARVQAIGALLARIAPPVVVPAPQ